MSAADTLREAAEALEQAAEKATQDRWRVGLVAGDERMPTVYRKAGVSGARSIADLFCSDDDCEPDPDGGWMCDDYENGRGDADYIALVDPEVGKALAEWLRELATWTHEGDDSIALEISTDHGTAIARAILREEEQP